jgi:cell division protein ZapA (FtsZ GTPase activity inhibitor)
LSSTSSEPRENPASQVRIDLLGTVFSIQTDESPEYMDDLVSELRLRISRLSTATRVNDPLKLSILAGIVLLDELRRARSASEDSTGKGNDEGDMAASSLLASLDKRLFEAGL